MRLPPRCSLDFWHRKRRGRENFRRIYWTRNCRIDFHGDQSFGRSVRQLWHGRQHTSVNNLWRDVLIHLRFLCFVAPSLSDLLLLVTFHLLPIDQSRNRVCCYGQPVSQRDYRGSSLVLAHKAELSRFTKATVYCRLEIIHVAFKNSSPKSFSPLPNHRDFLVQPSMV